MASTIVQSDQRRADRGTALHGLLDGVRTRLDGPGGYYNAGNALGLVMGIALQAGGVPSDGTGNQGALDAALQYLGGNAGAVMLTGATAVFFVSGEAYLRAWSHGAPPDPSLNRRGDVLSGVGALLLAIAFVSLGQWMLAATAGLLHAFGKFGSAWHWHTIPGWKRTWPNLYRTAVVASRVPAALAAFAAFIGVVMHFDAGTQLAALLTPLTLLVCTALWARADLMLFASNSDSHSGSTSD